MDELHKIMNKRVRYSEDYGSDDSNLHPAMSPASINSQLAPFLIKSETMNSAEDDAEIPMVQDFHQMAGSSQQFPNNVYQLMSKDALNLNDVDLHVLLTRCKDTPMVFRRHRDETYSNLMFNSNGVESEAEQTNYVECRLCGKIFTRSGGHLKRHRSKHYPELDTQPSNSNFEQSTSPQQMPPNFPPIEMSKNFRQNSPMLANNTDFNAIRLNERENLARALTQFCVQECLSPTIIHKRSFVELVNVLLNLGIPRNQPLMASTTLPPAELITTCIYRRFHWLAQEKVPKIQTDLLIYNGAFVVGCLPASPNLTALSVHYFDQKWTLKKAVVGLAPSDPQELESALTWAHCLDSVAAVNMQRQTLAPLICVSGNGSAIWAGKLKTENRSILCTCDLIERIADETLNYKVESNGHSEASFSIIGDLVDAAHVIMKFARFQIFTYSVKVPPDTVYKWMKILRVVEFILEELDHFRTFSSKPEVQNMLPKEFFNSLHLLESNRELVVELIRFLEIFRAAIIELQVIDEPTLPLVWPAIMTLKFDLISFSEESHFEVLKLVASNTLQLIERDMYLLIKEEHKTATFLNPKQRKLQHLLNPDEYEEFKNNLRKRLCIEKPKIERKLGDRRRFYEDDDESEKADELDRYLNAKRSGNETIVEFWRRNEPLMPRLSSEARRLLACPASTNYVCGNISHYVSKMTEFRVDAIAKLMITRSLEEI